MALTFACPACQKRLRANDQMAGRKIQCPSCGGAVRVPGAAGITARPTARPQPVPDEDDVVEDDLEEAPAPRPKRRREEDEDEERPAARSRRRDDEDDEADDRPGPRRKRKRKQAGSRMGLWIGLGVGVALLLLVVLGAGGGLVWWYYSSASSPLANAELFMPDNCQMLFSLRMEQIEGSGVYQQLKTVVPQMNQMSSDSQYRALQNAKIDRMIMGAGSVGPAPEFVAVVKTRQPVTVSQLQPADKGVTYKEEKVGRYTMYQGGTQAFCLADSRTVVLGPPDALRKVLARGKKAQLSPMVEVGLKHTDLSKSIAWAASLQEIRKEQAAAMRAMGGLAGGVNPLDNMEGTAGYASVDSDIHLVVKLLCRDTQVAENTRKQLDGLVVTVKQAPMVPRDVAQTLDGLKLSSKDNCITGEVTIRGSMLTNLARQQNAGPMFGGPPRP